MSSAREVGSIHRCTLGLVRSGVQGGALILAGLEQVVSDRIISTALLQGLNLGATKWEWSVFHGDKQVDLRGVTQVQQWIKMHPDVIDGAVVVRGSAKVTGLISKEGGYGESGKGR